MARETYIAAIAIILLVAFLPGIYLLKRLGEADSPEANSDKPEIVNIDMVARNPEVFKDPIGVTGKVIKVDEPNATFALGCKDGCVTVPVKYDGKMPELGTQVVVYGAVTSAEDGLYVFEGKSVKPK